MSPSPAAQPCVLIVDDAARIRDLLVELLDEEGYYARRRPGVTDTPSPCGGAWYARATSLRAST